MTSPIRDRVAIAGVAHSGCSRKAGVPAGVLAVRTCLAAIRDAGLEVADIDGVCGLSQWLSQDYFDPGPTYMIEGLGLPGVQWFGGALGGGVGPGLIGEATMAVASGLCTYALCFQAMSAPRPGQVYNYMGGVQAAGRGAYLLPYGLGIFMQQYAPWFQRYRYDSGLTEAQVGEYVVTARSNALRNEKAAMRSALTLEDYLASPFVCDPLRLLDCDVPVDACGAVIVTTAERARDLRNTPVYVSAISTGQGPRPDFMFWHDYSEMAAHWAARTVWDDSGLCPADMDFAMLYDGFSPFVFNWLEALQFVKRGEAGDFVASGACRPGGQLPVNTHGGNLSEGRTRLGHSIEAILQLQGRAGERQIAGARAGVVTGGGLMFAGALVLRN